MIESDFIFNSQIETGLRSLCILTSAPDIEFDLQMLVAFDYLVVHAGDFDKQQRSIHPSVMAKTGELLVRRRLIEQGLLLLEHKDLIKKLALEKGFFFQATDFSQIFMNSLTNSYIKHQLINARWAVNKFSGEGIFREVFGDSYAIWNAEFQAMEKGRYNQDDGILS